MRDYHVAFVTAAYGFAAFVLAALVVWIAADYRRQRKRLAELEALREQQRK